MFSTAVNSILSILKNTNDQKHSSWGIKVCLTGHKSIIHWGSNSIVKGIFDPQGDIGNKIYHMILLGNFKR